MKQLKVKPSVNIIETCFSFAKEKECSKTVFYSLCGFFSACESLQLLPCPTAEITPGLIWKNILTQTVCVGKVSN